MSSNSRCQRRSSRRGWLVCLLPVALGMSSHAMADCSDPDMAAAATAPNRDSEVGQCVVNPATGERVVVEDLILDINDTVSYVQTSDGDVILALTEVGDLLYCPKPLEPAEGEEPEPLPDECDDVYQVVSVEPDDGSGPVTTVNRQLVVDPPDPDDPDPPAPPPIEAQVVVQEEDENLRREREMNAETEGDDADIAPTVTAGIIDEQSRGRNGNNGGNAYGVRICLPVLGCATIGKRGSNGRPGQTLAELTRNVDDSHGDIASLADGVDGIQIARRGGNGGKGGGNFGNIGPYNGGNGGAGGNVTLNNSVDIVTLGDKARGIFVVSQAGSGGPGGGGFIGRAGSGGGTTTGGSVTINNQGDITTDGQASHGIYGLSIGGSGGAGGDSWGLIGRAGSGSAGGKGGAVTISNGGEVTTRGDDSHGLFAQSIGGTGGSGGNAGGAVALGGGGGGASNAGAVTITNASNGDVVTLGDNAIGVFAQSIGGGGGDGGQATGIAAVGAGSGGGGNGDEVTVTNALDATVTTTGVQSHGILAQSIGGGGGNARAAAGAVSIGAAGGSGGSGGDVEVINDGTIATAGEAARAILAQSISGGGGNGGSAGGLVTLGGAAGTASKSGMVTVSNAGDVTTDGDRAIAIQAQSIGGGGGNGGAAGGNVTVGGKGGGGGAAGEVIVTHTGSVTTSGDDALGILAEAIGGGGGNGGSSSSGGIITGATVGGRAGGGGDGAMVTVTLDEAAQNAATIATGGDRSVGILAQSVGGGGGNGGTAVQASAGTFVAISTAIGGAGGDGGIGGSVMLNGAGTITTEGTDAAGVLMQSVGGGGGNGGTTVAAAGQLGLAGGAVATVIGASGGDGGRGGQVAANFAGDVTTRGDAAAGLVIQSVGGGGGNGGTTVGAALNVSVLGGAAVSTAIGGQGGMGGNGGVVNATIGDDASRTIATNGDQSTAVLVQSVGGGGGNGGLTVAGAVSGSAGVDGAISTAIGGKGGSAGIGLTVTANVDSNVVTEGALSSGIVAQSIGGGGGNGGTAIGASAGLSGGGSLAVSTAIGGAGGVGRNGGSVISNIGLSQRNSIQTSGDRSTGVLVQSVGGGGGNGGTSVAGALAIGVGVAGGAVSTAIGGDGDVGGNGGSVTANVISDVSTAGEAASGVVVQSVGGGGGSGGLSVGAAVSGGGAGAASISTALGGGGGAGGNGGVVDATFDGTIETLDNNATGLLAQSVGGGGGNGGGAIAASLSASPGVGAVAISVGIGGDGGAAGDGGNTVDGSEAEDVPESFAVTLDAGGMVVTRGDNASAVVAQSIGGGGGNGGYSISASGALGGGVGGALAIGIGGNGAGGGDGKAVSATSGADIMTAGSDSAGLTVQSIGGGGGNGGYNVSATLTGGGAGGGSVSVGIGGSGDGGGDGGKVVAVSNGTIITEGDRSTGLLAQSVGGGGGNGGATVSASVTGTTGVGAALSIGVGGSGSGGGNGALVVANSTADIVTLGESATGVLAQSVGGGGGNGGVSVAGSLSVAGSGGGSGAIAIGGSGAGGGDGGMVRLDVANDVSTLGDNADGVIAQSVGGGGGNGGLGVGIGVSGSSGLSLAGGVGVGGSGGGAGNGSRVDSQIDGTVTTAGQNAVGVLTQSVGGGGGNGGIGIGGAVSIGGATSVGAAVGVGGSGAGGGDGSVVAANVSGYVQTTGDDAIGVLTQSVGGGGGNGGTSIGGALNGGSSGGALAIAIGGSGGTGGVAGEAASDVTAGVITTGDRSSAVVTQSVGGGGGNGGVSVAGAVTLTQGSGGALALGVGGFGGAGGDSFVDQDNPDALAVSSTVRTTDANNQIGTTGDDATAIIAQSIGGGGGNGGLNVSAALSMSGTSGAAIGIGVGGFGGGAGDAGNVALDVAGEVVTEGNNSHGLLAQSLGGGGGNGGVNVSGAVSLISTGTSSSAAIGVGGFGGSGGDSGNVELDFLGSVFAQSLDRTGLGSHGIVAQSIAGGGGNGGVNVASGLSFNASDVTGSGNALVLGVGGFGGAGGDAGSVTARIAEGSRVVSFGDDRSAVLAQSIGGGGGNGATNVSAGIASDAPIVFGMGGFGGAAGFAGDVNVTAQADLFATGDNARGIFAQSIGGGGGNGGLNVSGAMSFSEATSVPTITFGMGGFGGAGNISGNVNVTQAGNIMTEGRQAHGIFAQSLGGGGGNGGMNLSTSLTFAGQSDRGSYKRLSIVAGIGGHGGEGANGLNSVVQSSGDIATSGDYARGIFAQSIGGGGGNGGINFSGNLAKRSSLVTMGIGGFGAGAGDAGLASVTRGSVGSNAGLISTDGNGAIGIEATSIGGGGGDAGANIVAALVLADEGTDAPATGEERERPRHEGVDDEVFTNYDAVIAELQGRAPMDEDTSQDTETGQSPYAVQLAIGGAGGGAGNGGAAEVTHFGDILTAQQNSHGILAQSIGGGGGNAAYNVALTFLEEGASNRGLSLSLGGATGDGGLGNEVTVEHDGAIETLADDSHGILAQSIGGGGGNAATTMDIDQADAGKLAISIGRRGGEGGAGGDVTLNSAGSVVTRGDRSWGLLAQSIGNGGGNSATTTIATGGDDQGSRLASMSIGLEGGEGGEAGDVTIDLEGMVVTEGDDAHAVFAQSVGGGGGNGGDAKGSASGAVLAIGGSGGIGGTGGVVSVTSDAEIMTSGRGAMGIVAQSIGGGGGTGGKSDATITGNAAALAVNLGGDGGEGAIGADVTVNNGGTVVTEGDTAHAVFAQSLGGGGGNGSMTITNIGEENELEPDDFPGGDEEDETQGPQLALSVGGSGGEGATAGDVAVINAGNLQSRGRAAAGIFAQSVGGGGGNADQVVTNFSSVGIKTSMGLGGSGGSGGESGDVRVDNLADESGNVGRIVTTGDNAHGIVAMSIGGGGGTGGSVASRSMRDDSSISFEPPQGGATSIKIGGDGGSGGTSGLVTVNNEGEIMTVGDGSHGVLAQSIGGGGGNGGVVFVQQQSIATATAIEHNLSIGGEGGDGNVSGDVEVFNRGAIDVWGDGAHGVFAQSIGGGGGNGGAAGVVLPEDQSAETDRDLLMLPTVPSFVDVSLGGAGGVGADSGDVTVEHTGSIVARGDNAFGIFAQSVAGGGGTLGASYGSAIGAARDILLPAVVGSTDGGTGTAGTVEVNSEGTIVMLGANSRAHNVQSVNGGGGDLRLSLDVSELTAVDDTDDPATISGPVRVGSEAVESGAGSDVEASHDGDLMTLGDNASASVTQSIGGGGGSGQILLTTNDDTRVDLDLTLGGADSADSAGGDIEIDRDGSVMTAGNNATATSVQSIGGGGGTLDVQLLSISTDAGSNATPKSTGVQHAGTIKLTDTNDRSHSPVTLAPQVASASANIAALTLGADLSADNAGGDLVLDFSGDHVTEGDLSPALLIQSIGAGGGDARLQGFDQVSVSFGGTNGATGDGGNISLDNLGDVFTGGQGSYGVVLQSIGGGGGFTLTDLPAGAVDWSLSDANQGSGGSITFNQNGDIAVTADGAIALVAQSLGGGGGILDRAFMGTAGGVGSSGDIAITLDGSVMAMGAEGIGLFAQSVGSDGQGDISVSLGRDHFIYAGESGIAMSLSGGVNNVLTNEGTIATADDVDGMAVIADGGSTRIDNLGMLVGDIRLTGGSNAFNNADGAEFFAGRDVDLGGAESMFDNSGAFVPGRVGNAQMVNLNGSFRQAASGSTLADIDFATNSTDQVFATGNVELAGTVRTSVLNAQRIPIGSFSQTLFSGESGVIDDGLVLDAMPSVVLQQDLRFTDSAALLDYTVDFAVDGMSGNLLAVGDYINRGQQAGGGNLGYGNVISKLVFDPDLASYRNSLSQLSPDFYGEHQVQLIHSTADFAQRLMRCKQPGGESRVDQDGSCVWVQMDRFSTDRDKEVDYKDIDGTTDRYSVGIQRAIPNGWSLGVGLTRERNASSGFEDAWRSSASTDHWGLMASRRYENTLWSGVFSYGASSATTNRRGELLTSFDTFVERDINTFSGVLEVSHQLPFGNWYLKPSVGAGIVEMRAKTAAERGADALSLEFISNNETHTWLRPAIELGRQFSVGENSLVRLNLELSAQEYLSGSTTDIKARLAGAPVTIDPLSVGTDLGDPLYRARFGVDLFTEGKFSAQFFVDTGTYNRSDTDTVNLRLEFPLR